MVGRMVECRSAKLANHLREKKDAYLFLGHIYNSKAIVEIT